MAEPVLIFFRQGAYDALHEGLSIAAAAVSGGRPVQLYFSWWALEVLIVDRLDEPELREDVAATMERRGVPTLRQLLHHVRASKLAAVYACSGSLQALGYNPSDVEGRVDELVGWSAILRRTAGRADRFFV